MDEPLWPEVARRFFCFASILFGETKGMGVGHVYLSFILRPCEFLW